MSIEDHKWSDIDGVWFDKIYTNKDVISIEPVSRSLHLDKRDSIALAKHFKHDRESLVNKVKVIISKCDEAIEAGKSVGSNVMAYEMFRVDLQSLINEETGD